MTDKIILGRYIPVDSPLHRLDARSKIVFVFGFILIVFLANNVTTNVILFLFTIGTVVISNVPYKFLLNGLKPILIIILFTFLLHLFFTKEGDLVVEWGWIKIYEEGIRQGIFISLRFIYLILITSLLTLTTSPITLTDGLESLLNPLKKVKMPVHELALMMSISLRFIPTLMEETEKIMKAQTARGVEFSSGPIKERVKAIVPLLIPLFVSSFKRAEELALAMEARGYKGGEGRTKYRELKWETRDHVLMMIFAGLTAILWFLRS
ncbi:MAG TPA: energy-coupling factor transporter transmembrane protein EcfT [Bacillus sp. (in: firmicutes)]|uniref:energy-coupling factor transporter transmembrane component T family protein n=1 Tax=Bacillus litorisediminis TaxID=2922713 RepID=UPI001FACEFFF|nr:energy-coupling factor transporter transmembrane protein EcfT [Bacillus litorisediminis]HWO78626.1 energy-coupling factor transporter transmembrane protein EcfT [Bacillus sp. (in: firmicutes)]